MSVVHVCFRHVNFCGFRHASEHCTLELVHAATDVVSLLLILILIPHWGPWVLIRRRPPWSKSNHFPTARMSNTEQLNYCFRKTISNENAIVYADCCIRNLGRPKSYLPVEICGHLSQLFNRLHLLNMTNRGLDFTDRLFSHIRLGRQIFCIHLTNAEQKFIRSKTRCVRLSFVLYYAPRIHHRKYNSAEFRSQRFQYLSSHSILWVSTFAHLFVPSLSIGLFQVGVCDRLELYLIVQSPF